ncbi:MAG: UDP-2,3-diacylglucosamine diphosphatase [Alistipes sp.]
MIYFASDIHLGGGGNVIARDVERRFVAWLDRVGADAEAIFLVGDVFDFWFEYREVVPKGFVRVLGRLSALTDRGVRVVFFTGNHDMWVGDYLTRECGVEIHTEPALLTLAGKRVFVAHGDNMNIHHLPMLRFMNTIFRSRTLYWLFSWLVHPDWAMRFGHWWSGSSRKKHNAEGGFEASLTEPLIDYARDYARTHEVDYFVFGHMHFARDYKEEGLHVLHLGCWEKNPACAVLDDAGQMTLEKIDER